jgi:hypothetical protein
MLPAALLVLSCVLPWCHAIKLGKWRQVEATPEGPEEAKWMSWWQQGNRSQLLKIRKLPVNNESTVIVTHAGKNDQQFIDMAVMLGISLSRHLPDYPKIALGVKGMTDENQELLKNAGWYLVLVGDWRAPPCESCIDDEFTSRFQDSWERLNAFRLPVGRVLYMDADTYVVNDKLGELLNSTDLPPGHIAMVPSSYTQKGEVGCQNGFSSSVMLFRPDMSKYLGMMTSVAQILAGNASQRSDEQIITNEYNGAFTRLDTKFGCVYPSSKEGPDACSMSCVDVVVSHFTGLPKPSLADVEELSKVKGDNPETRIRRASKVHRKALSSFYRDLVENKEMLTRPLQDGIALTEANGTKLSAGFLQMPHIAMRR